MTSKRGRDGNQNNEDFVPNMKYIDTPERFGEANKIRVEFVLGGLLLKEHIARRVEAP
jgi:hypothetical protein